MLDLLFSRNSRLALSFEIAGLVLLIPVIVMGRLSVAFAIYLLGYLLIRMCVCWNWYRADAASVSKDHGIKLHFRKVLVPAAYLIFLTNLSIILWNAKALVYISIPVFAFILYVNFTLIYLHLKDKDRTPPNFFSGASH